MCIRDSYCNWRELESSTVEGNSPVSETRRPRVMIQSLSLIHIFIKLKYPESFKVAEEIGKAINEDFSLEVAEDEIGYWALHVERIRKNE